LQSLLRTFAKMSVSEVARRHAPETIAINGNISAMDNEPWRKTIETLDSEPVPTDVSHTETAVTGREKPAYTNGSHIETAVTKVDTSAHKDELETDAAAATYSKLKRLPVC